MVLFSTKTHKQNQINYLYPSFIVETNHFQQLANIYIYRYIYIKPNLQILNIHLLQPDPTRETPKSAMK